MSALHFAPAYRIFSRVMLSSLGVTAVAGALTLRAADEPARRPRPNTGNAHPNGPAAAAEDTAKLKAADGLAATLWASEPMVRNPTDFDIDAFGRVWVCEGVNYRSSFQSWGVLQPAGDRIVVLEDRDGDGRAEAETVFYQDPSINAALGIGVFGNRVIVSCSPHVFVLTDTDGDGKADRRELLFTDIKGFDHDHAVHAFVFGPDGTFYFNFGNAGKQLKRPKAADRVLPLHGPVPKEVISAAEPVVDAAGLVVRDHGKPYREGMVFRCDLDGGNLETLGWNFRNNYEVCVDSFGTLWQSDNDDDGNRGVRINFVMEYGNYGYVDELTGRGWNDAWKKAQGRGIKEEERPRYHWHLEDPGVVPNLLQTGNGSPTGIAIYEGELLPEVFRNQILHCDAGPRVVRAYPVRPDGAGYAATTNNLLTSADGWYRPADVAVAPDGSVFIADWHDAGVGGHNMADRKAETMTGRIYRVAPAGHQPANPKWSLDTAEGAIAALRSPNMAARYLGWTRLRELGAAAEPALQQLWQDPNPRMRARALQLLARIPGRASTYVAAGLKEPDSDLRITALRIARALRLPEFPGLLEQAAKDPSAQVRREVAVALHGRPPASRVEVWVTLAKQHQAGDRWSLEALGIAAAGGEDACFAGWLAAVGEGWNTPAGREIVWRSRSPKSAALLAKLALARDTSAADKTRYVRALDFLKGPEKEAALAEIATGGF